MESLKLKELWLTQPELCKLAKLKPQETELAHKPPGSTDTITKISKRIFIDLSVRART